MRFPACFFLAALIFSLPSLSFGAGPARVYVADDDIMTTVWLIETDDRVLFRNLSVFHKDKRLFVSSSLYRKISQTGDSVRLELCLEMDEQEAGHFELDDSDEGAHLDRVERDDLGLSPKDFHPAERQKWITLKRLPRGELFAPALDLGDWSLETFVPVHFLKDPPGFLFYMFKDRADPVQAVSGLLEMDLSAVPRPRDSCDFRGVRWGDRQDQVARAERRMDSRREERFEREGDLMYSFFDPVAMAQACLAYRFTDGRLKLAIVTILSRGDRIDAETLQRVLADLRRRDAGSRRVAALREKMEKEGEGQSVFSIGRTGIHVSRDFSDAIVLRYGPLEYILESSS